MIFQGYHTLQNHESFLHSYQFFQLLRLCKGSGTKKRKNGKYLVFFILSCIWIPVATHLVSRWSATSVPLHSNGYPNATQKAIKFEPTGYLLPQKRITNWFRLAYFHAPKRFFSSGNDIEDTLFFVTLLYNTIPLTVNIYYFRFGNPE